MLNIRFRRGWRLVGALVLLIFVVWAALRFFPFSEPSANAQGVSVDADAALSSLAPASLSTLTPSFAPVAAALPDAGAPLAVAAEAPANTAANMHAPDNQGNACIIGQVVDDAHIGQAEWTVRLHPVDDPAAAQVAVTDAGGNFRVEGLEDGEWTLTLDMRAGWEAITAPKFNVTLSGAGGACTRVRFQNWRLGCVVGRKIDQRDGLGLAGWQMTATRGDTTLTATTDGLGEFRFENLSPGQWTVAESEQSGWAPATWPYGRQVITVIAPRQVAACQAIHPFVNMQVPTPTLTPTPTPTPQPRIQVHVVDAGYRGLSGWSVQAAQEEGDAPLEGITEENGTYSFTLPEPGTWIVSEQVRDGWEAITPQLIAVPIGPQEVKQVRFKNRSEKVCASGVVRDENQSPLTGWRVTAQLVESTRPAQYVWTGPDGGYTVQDLDAQRWRFSVTLPLGWKGTNPSDATVELALRQPADGCVLQNFELRSPRVCADVYVKDSHDGAGLPDWNISLKNASTGTTQDGTTDGSGHLRFADLKPGWYVLTLETKMGWVSIWPSRWVNLLPRADEQCEMVVFYNYQRATPADPPGTPPAHCRFQHRVAYRETTFSIARRYGTTVQAIAVANGLANPNYIMAGQILCIP